jgi:Tfp pilus assembly protein PilX
MIHTHTVQKTLHRSSGVALITVLLLLSLFTVMTLSMVIATSSDTMIDGYYRNFRGSFYAADSGINATRTYMLQQLIKDIPPTYTLASGAPIPAGTEATVLSAATNTSAGFGAFQSLNGTQTASWAGTFKLDAANTTLTAGTSTAVPAYSDACTPVYTGAGTTPPTCTTLGTPAANYTITGYKYTYQYKITAIGQSRANETHTIEEDGDFIVTVDKGTPAGTNTNFAAYGMFIDKFPICSGTLVNGTITGPVFTNDSWSINSGSYIFTDAVGSAGTNIGYTDGNGCYQQPGSATTHSYTASDGTNFNPTFQGSVTLGAPKINLPNDSFSQKEAVLDSLGNGLTATTPTQMNAILKDASGTKYPTTPPSTGVFLPYYDNGGTPTFGTAAGAVPLSTTVATTVGGTTTYTTVTDPYMSGGSPAAGCGGGIYVEGAATVTITPSNTGDKLAQIYTIKQGGTTTTVTVDPGGSVTVGGTTTVYPAQTILTTGGSSKTISGVPQQCDPNTGAPVRDATMLYVNGDITALQGAGAGVGAIQDGNALTVTSAGAVTITGDLLYKTEPVTLNTADTLVSGADHGQVLGIFTANGNVNLNNLQSSGNLEIDASVATISATGSGGITNTGSSIGTLNIVGGRIQNTIQNINSNNRNVYFDRRFANGGFAPPWFPSTTITSNGVVNDTVVVNPPTRISWTDKTAM